MTQLKVNWRLIIKELKFSHGMSLRDIGQEIGVSYVSVRSYFMQDWSPNHETGERIVDLWMAVTKKPRESIPKEQSFPSAARA